MKKLFVIALLLVCMLIAPFSMTAGVLNLLVNYTPGKEKILNISEKIKDGYWSMPVIDVPATL